MTKLKKWCFCVLVSVYACHGMYVKEPIDPFEGKREPKDILAALRKIQVGELEKKRGKKDTINYQEIALISMLKSIAVMEDSKLDDNIKGLGGIQENLITIPKKVNKYYVGALGLLKVIGAWEATNLDEKPKKSIIMTLNKTLIQTFMELQPEDLYSLNENKGLKKLGIYRSFIGCPEDQLKNKEGLFNPNEAWDDLGDEGLPVCNAIAIKYSTKMIEKIKNYKLTEEVQYNIYYVALFCFFSFIFGAFTGAVHNEVQREDEMADRSLQDKKNKKKRGSIKKSQQDDADEDEDETENDEDLFAKKKTKKRKKKS